MNNTSGTHQVQIPDEQKSLNFRQVIRFLIFAFLTPGAALIAAWDARWPLNLHRYRCPN